MTSGAVVIELMKIPDAELVSIVTRDLNSTADPLSLTFG
jgi:hypothetical protein